MGVKGEVVDGALGRVPVERFVEPSRCARRERPPPNVPRGQGYLQAAAVLVLFLRAPQALDAHGGADATFERLSGRQRAECWAVRGWFQGVVEAGDVVVDNDIWYIC